MMRSDIFHPHHNTPEASDNNFGFFRSMKREFNIMEFVGIREKIERKRAAMYESDLKCYCSKKKGYQATLSYFVQKTNDCTGGLANVVVVVLATGPCGVSGS